MSKAELAFLIGLWFFIFAIATAESPRSYLYAVITGECFAKNAPRGCSQGGPHGPFNFRPNSPSSRKPN